MVSHPRCVG